jgi:hypothetical protein
MPIENGYVVYSIPDNIKQMIDKNLLSAMRNELYWVSNLSLSDYAYESAATNSGTAGWNVALALACLKTNKREVYEYYRTLPWYDSDTFDGQFEQMLITEGLVRPGYEIDHVCEELKLSVDDVGCCEHCGKVFFKEQLIKSYVSHNPDWDVYLCQQCDIKTNHKDESTSANNYYLNGLKTLDAEFKSKNNNIES